MDNLLIALINIIWNISDTKGDFRGADIFSIKELLKLMKWNISY